MFFFRFVSNEPRSAKTTECLLKIIFVEPFHEQIILDSGWL
jgi:hypothetical protein